MSTSPQPPKPGPVPGPAPSVVRPAAPAPAGPAAGDREAALAEALAHGRADESGRVFLRTASGEREVGQYPDASPEEALRYFAGKHLDLVEQIALLEARLESGADAADVGASARARREELAEANVVGDVDALAARTDALIAAAGTAAAEQASARAAQLEEGRRLRTAVVVEAEEIAGQDPARTQWKQSAARMRELFEMWKSVQSGYPRLPRAEDRALWGRFSAARAEFDRGRRAHFSELDARSAEGRRIKEKLIARAEELSSSTQWRETAAKYRELMDEWKAAPRAGRKHDDALWARFRAAQDVFFDARTAENERIDAGYRENLVAKEALLAEARGLLPVKDLERTKAALRGLQERWEDAGRVPRADVSRMEGGLREVERAVAEAEEAAWKRSNPEHRARATGMLAQLEDGLAELRTRLERAEAAGDARAASRVREELATKQAWYDQLARSAEDLG